MFNNKLTIIKALDLIASRLTKEIKIPRNCPTDDIILN